MPSQSLGPEEQSDREALKHSLSLYRAALESTTEGVLIVGIDGKVRGFNSPFLRLWRIPESLAASGDDDAMIAFVLTQLKDPDGFLAKVRDLYATPEAVSFDVLEFTDDRVFERYSQPQVLDDKVVGRVWSFRDVTRQRKVEDALRQSERRLRQIVDLVPHFIFAKDEHGRFLLANKALADAYGTTVEEIVGKTDADFSARAEEVARFRADDRRVIHGGQVLHIDEESITDATGRIRWLETTKIRFTVSGTQQQVVLGVANDITERRLLEAELRQAQKMEAVGRLAGGVAHDFNNLLTAILGFSTALLDELESGDPRRHDVDDIIKAARRAAELTRQLLAFSRRQVLRLRVIDVNHVVAGVRRLLGRVIGEDIQVETRLDPGLKPVKADAAQLEQVIVNLAINAREAMPLGGQIVLETANAARESLPASLHQRHPDRSYVRVRVSDTGVGIAPEVLRRIFEPFFTTKEHGTGLGLSMVYGVVQQTGGEIEVKSDVGLGTSFDIYLPATDEPLAAERPASAAVGRTATETILLAEDEEAVRRLTRRLLEADGYVVLEAPNGVEALRVSEQWGGRIDLLVTDLIMPRMNGCDLAEAIRARRPEIAVAYISGYSADARGSSVWPDQAAPFLQKPFDGEALRKLVRSALDEKQQG